MSKKHLKHKLNMANKTVHDLMQEIDKCESIKENYAKSIMALRDKLKSSLDEMNDIHERQMKVAENEIKRLNTIIDFLYMRGRESL